MNKPRLSKNAQSETCISEALHFGISAILKKIYHEEKKRSNLFEKKNPIMPLLNRISYLDRSSYECDEKYKNAKCLQEKNIQEIEELISLNPEEMIKEIFNTNHKALFNITVNGKKKLVIGKDMIFDYILETILCRKKYKKILTQCFNKIVELYSDTNFLPFAELEKEADTMDTDVLKEEAYCLRVKCLDVFQQNILLSAILWRNRIINDTMFDGLCVAINNWFCTVTDDSEIRNNQDILLKEKNILICTLAKYFEILTVNLRIEERSYFHLPNYIAQKVFVTKHTPTMRFML
jgi:hypothetical protein